MGETSPIGSVLSIRPSTMIVHHPDIPSRATRGEEVVDQDLDKAAREFAGKF